MPKSTSEAAINEMATAVGLAISAWSQVEGKMVDTLAICLGPSCLTETSDGGFAYQLTCQKEASEILFAVENFRSKLSMVSAIVRGTLSRAGLATVAPCWDPLEKRISKFSKRRNVLAHLTIMYLDTMNAKAGAYLTEPLAKQSLWDKISLKDPGIKTENVKRFTTLFKGLAKEINQFNLCLMRMPALRDRHVLQIADLLDFHERNNPNEAARLKLLLAFRR